VIINTHFSFKFEDGKIKEQSKYIAPFQYKSYVQPATNHKSNVTEIGKKPDSTVVVRIKEFVEDHSPNSRTAGYFVAEDVHLNPVEYIIQMWSTDKASSKIETDKILAEGKAGRNTYLINLKAAWKNEAGFNNVHYKSLKQYIAPKEPKARDMKKDKLGTEVYYSDFKNFFIEDGCVSCLKPIPTSEWENLDKYIVLPESEVMFCPDCQEPHVVESCKEFLETNRYNFMKNWS
jgi:hypothetical protein